MFVGEYIDFPLHPMRPGLEVRGPGEHFVLIGQGQATNRIVDYIAAHRRGRVLVSGYSGVGKSSMIRAALHDLRERLGDTSLVVIEPSARKWNDPKMISQRLIWHLRWDVAEGRVALKDSARERLLEAFDGVAASGREHVTGDEDEGTVSADVTRVLKLGASARHKSTTGLKTTYVPYDVETSLLEVANLITAVGAYRPRRGFDLVRRLFASRPAEKLRLPVVVVDRVTDWDVLVGLNNLFTVPDAVFLVVVDPDVRAQWLGRSEAGYDDLPAFQDIYLSCLWDDLPKMLRSHLDVDAASAQAQALYDKFVGFLAFSCAGIPTKCIEVLLRHQSVDHRGRPVARFDGRGIETIELFDSLYRMVLRRENDILGPFTASLGAAERDRARRFVLMSIRSIITRGTVSGDALAAIAYATAPSLLPPNHRAILSALVRVLVEENVLGDDGSAFVLSDEARDHVARGREILGTGVLPRVAVPIAAPPPPPPIMPLEPAGSSTRVPGPPTRALEQRTIGGRYTILRAIGAGGMAQVYLAQDLQLGRRVAIKVMHSVLLQDPEMVGRFTREVTLARQLTHPNIAQVYDFGRTEDGQSYFAMEYIDGQPLSALLGQRGKLPVLEALLITLQVAEALVAASAEAIVHRDLKPENIMITIDSGGMVAKVVDFGIARIGDSASDRVTRTGVVVGTPRYMSPEQAAGDQVDHRSDLYSLGFILFEMLTGSAPFDNLSAQESIIRRVTAESEELRPRLSDVSPELADVVIRATERLRDRRYQSARELIAALGRVPEATPAG
jgi:tRNA A-37 threonylcarbamoyl transferase component Bud32